MEQSQITFTILYYENENVYLMNIIDMKIVIYRFRHKFKIQKVDKMEEKRQRNCYLSFRVT
jgi:hypothetical protein